MSRASYDASAMTIREAFAIKLMAGPYAGTQDQATAIDWAIAGADALLTALEAKPELPPIDPLTDEPE